MTSTRSLLTLTAELFATYVIHVATGGVVCSRSPEAYGDSNHISFTSFFLQFREVSLFTQVKNGKVYGAESTPFVLPRRWTFKTLSSCVADYVNRNNTGKELIIKQLYYKRAHAKGVVKLNSDCNISALLQEYPMHRENERGPLACT